MATAADDDVLKEDPNEQFCKNDEARHEKSDKSQHFNNQMEDATTPQAAASDPVESPESGSSGTDTVHEVEMKAEEKVQNEHVRLQVDVDKETLKKVGDVKSKSKTCGGSPVDDSIKPVSTGGGSPVDDSIKPVSTGGGSPVDSDPGGPSNQAESGDEMDVDQEAAASGSMESPESGSSGPDSVDEVGEEVKKKEKVQPEASSGGNSSWWPWSKQKGSKPKAKNRTPRVKAVKVHSVTTGQTFGADDEILEKVKSLLSSTQVKIITDCQHCDIIIVFCPITSRVGADVPAAMRKAPGNKPVILVLMHHTRDVDYSTGVRKWSETYQNVKLDVHVLFHETQPGLLKCPRNDEAVQQIQKVLKALSK